MKTKIKINKEDLNKIATNSRSIGIGVRYDNIKKNKIKIYLFLGILVVFIILAIFLSSLNQPDNSQSFQPPIKTIQNISQNNTPTDGSYLNEIFGIPIEYWFFGMGVFIFWKMFLK